ncbi:MAG TPA: thiamine pyrophosphate-binding protein, partial [Thermoanaerobaculia bacterium]|nr:thiamine pyrophosphate-binding protein [Thermoanaerobaculia bacterium]
LELLLGKGFDFFTGVPDSTFKALFREIESRPEIGYVPAVSENVALGVATGAWLGGRRPVVIMQNSGLALAVNALASLLTIYRIPALLVVGWRGHDGSDSPEHKVTGAATLPLLNALGIAYHVPHTNTIEESLASAMQSLDTQRMPAAMVFRPGVLA